MRVISGIAGGRNLKAPKGRDVRPTSDKVRGAIFNIVVANWERSIEGARVADLFAGTGALGIEALSRGAASCLFLEKDPNAIAVLEENLKTTHLAANGRVVARDVEKTLGVSGTFGLIFVDPPYDLVPKSQAIAQLGEILAPGGLAIVEHESRVPPTDPAGLVAFDRREYGSTGITFFRRLE